MEKRVMNELWGDLAARLNDIGPPAFSEAEWKRKWTVHKHYEKKRRLKLLGDSETHSGKFFYYFLTRWALLFT